MRARLLLVVLVAMLLAPTNPVPVRAATDDVCTGVGTMVTSEPLTDMFVTPNAPVHASWSFSFSVGLCVQKLVLVTAGFITGWCDYSSGQGITNNGHRFAFIGVGRRLFFTGEVVGEIPFLPDPVEGHSCLTGARRFLVGHGATLLWECKAVEHGGTEGPVLGVPLHHHECA